MDVVKIIARRVAICLALAAVLTAVGIRVAPAHADPYPWYNCPPYFQTTYLSYYYPAGGYYVAAGPWHEYGTEAHPGCVDINVEMWNTGGMDIRTQICPYSGSCYIPGGAPGWGTLASPSPTYGVTAHQYHLPCNGACAFRFRIETRHWTSPGTGVAENLRIAF